MTGGALQQLAELIATLSAMLSLTARHRQERPSGPSTTDGGCRPSQQATRKRSQRAIAPAGVQNGRRRRPARRPAPFRFLPCRVEHPPVHAQPTTLSPSPLPPLHLHPRSQWESLTSRPRRRRRRLPPRPPSPPPLPPRRRRSRRSVVLTLPCRHGATGRRPSSTELAWSLQVGFRSYCSFADLCLSPLVPSTEVEEGAHPAPSSLVVVRVVLV